MCNVHKLQSTWQNFRFYRNQGRYSRGGYHTYIHTEMSIQQQDANNIVTAINSHFGSCSSRKDGSGGECDVGVTPSSQDVLMGRGNSHKNHPGNVTFQGK